MNPDDYEMALRLFGSIATAVGLFQVLGALGFFLTIWACLRRAGWL